MLSTLGADRWEALCKLLVDGRRGQQVWCTEAL